MYAKNLNLNIDLVKNKMTGKGNTTEAVFKYIHTYSALTGSVSISRGVGISLSGTSKQWTLVAVVRGIAY